MMKGSYMFAELDVVALTHNITEYDLSSGSRGTIVHLYKDGKAFEVEFIDDKGHTTALITLTPKDVLLVWSKHLHIDITFSDHSTTKTEDEEWNWASLKYLKHDKAIDCTDNFRFF